LPYDGYSKLRRCIYYIAPVNDECFGLFHSSGADVPPFLSDIFAAAAARHAMTYISSYLDENSTDVLQSVVGWRRASAPAGRPCTNIVLIRSSGDILDDRFSSID